MKHDVVIVGGGLAGLSAAAYLCKAGLSVAILEKEQKFGGLVNSFERDGFIFDGGIRAIENSGIVTPMLKQLGIDIDFLSSPVSVGFGKDVLRLASNESLEDYKMLLIRQFPNDADDIKAIIATIATVMEYMDVLYGIDNPLFLDLKNAPEYVYKTILPWLLKYILTMPKVGKLQLPVDEYLARFTKNQALIDMIGQHFFKKTPTFFALSYFSLYLDYRYPMGGTGSLPAKMLDYIQAHGGEPLAKTEVSLIDPQRRLVADTQGNEYEYTMLLWAADSRFLYRNIDIASMPSGRQKARVQAKAIEVADKKGGDSIFTLYLALNLDSSYLSDKASPHLFYTPVIKGLSSLGPIPSMYTDKESIKTWIRSYLELTTYEISCPALRDPSLAPAGKTGLIVSTLMDYGIVKGVSDAGWYDNFKDLCSDIIVEVLQNSIYPGLASAILDKFSSTPLTIEKTTGNSDGAITGWAFTNPSIPAIHDLPKVAQSVRTPIPGVYQAGQWSFSPSGLPISILTGKLAADAIIKQLKR
ncbi:MAG: NAD(P)/FAD-dependent oxidoreductase [Spirochaetia bacterium]|nr:NAD(P)/FAD-dependent oxidoreductase [Spirochaetia bacterium]